MSQDPVADGPSGRHFPALAIRSSVAAMVPDRETPTTPVETIPAARHRIPRPLPEPHRSKRVSRAAPPPIDRLGRLLEDWLAELPVRYTHSGD